MRALGSWDQCCCQTPTMAHAQPKQSLPCNTYCLKHLLNTEMGEAVKTLAFSFQTAAGCSKAAVFVSLRARREHPGEQNPHSWEQNSHCTRT